MTQSRGSAHFDVVVIGSGAGGSTVFWRLAKLGWRVALYEAGPDLSKMYSQLSPLEIISRGTTNGSGRAYLGKPPFPFIEGTMLGGTTEINGGLFWRTPSLVFDAWRETGFLSWLDDSEIESAWEDLEAALSVKSEVSRENFDLDSLLLAKGFEKLGVRAEAASRAVRNCLKANRCAFGCPTGAKQSMSKSLIPAAVNLGGNVFPDRRVKEIIQKSASLFELQVNSPAGVEKVTSTIVVVSGGVHESPRMVANVLGRPLLVTEHSLHLNLKVLARHSEAINAVHGTIFTRQIQEYLDDGVLIMPSQSGKHAMAVSRASVAPKFDQEFRDNLDRLAVYTIQISLSRKAQQLTLRRGSLLRHRLSSEDQRRMEKYIKRLIEALALQGFESFSIYGDTGFQEQRDIEGELQSLDLNRLDLSSVHAMGGLSLGGNHVSETGELRSVPGVFVADASVLPGATLESPQGSIMLAAYGIAHQINRKLSLTT